ncbi:MAG: hypothetical protein PHE59_05365 [Patescibacteria group bacterium]|nr:hypothetical protein [Patescibacteria group bacterium]
MDLTPAQVTTYKRKGWKVLTTTFDLTYKKHWDTPWFFIREFYQNALDEHDEAGVKEAPSIRQGSAGAVIEDHGRGLGAESLLMRETKVQDDLRGQFGEGLKFACIAAVRMGYTPVIESSRITIEAHSIQQVMGGQPVQLLTFLWKETSGRSSGTQATIKGYHGNLYTDRFIQFIGKPVAYFGREMGRFLRQDQLFREPRGRLYVRDIYIRDLTSDFSYNLWDMKLNPDRVSEIAHDQLLHQMAYPWSQIGTTELAVDLIEAMASKAKEERQMVFAWGRYPPDAYVQDAWRQLHGNAVVYTDGMLRDLARGYGYKVVGEEFSSQLRDVLVSCSVKTDSNVVEARIEELSEPQILPVTNLSQVQKTNLLLVQFLAASYPATRGAVITPANIAQDPRTKIKALGLCDGKNIYLVPEVLVDEEQALGVAYHELGHYVGGDSAWDGSTAHTKAVQKVGAALSILMRQRYVDVMKLLGAQPEVVPAASRPRSARVASCQCENKNCPHGDKPCPNMGTDQVTPSYLLCSTCASRMRRTMVPMKDEPRKKYWP